MRTNTRPYDYERRVPTPPDDLFTVCPSCGYRLAIKDGELISCYSCGALEQFTPEQAEEFKALDIVVGYVPPEPEMIEQSVNLVYGTDPLDCEDWPGKLGEEDWRENRKQEWQSFLSRMNAPEMVARRGTELTPYGWRKP